MLTLLFVIIYLWISTIWILIHVCRKNNQNFILPIIFWPFLIPFFIYIEYFDFKK